VCGGGKTIIRAVKRCLRTCHHSESKTNKGQV
jgi:hypothetical protein